MAALSRLRVLVLLVLVAAGLWIVFLLTRGDQVRLDCYGDPLPEGAIARIGSTRLRHCWAVSSLAFLHDGRTLAAGDDEIVRLWDSASGKEIRHFNAEVGQIRVMAVSPDGKHLAV